MTADQDVNNALNGVDANGNALPYAWTRVRARTVYGNLDGNKPFSWPNPNGAATVSRYDQIEGTAEQIAFRYIDTYGNVWETKKLFLVLIEWLLDGAPSPLSLDKLAGYMTNAGQLRPWPTGFGGAFPGEATQTYPAFPPTAPVTPAPVTPTPQPAPAPGPTPAAPPTYDPGATG